MLASKSHKHPLLWWIKTKLFEVVQQCLNGVIHLGHSILRPKTQCRFVTSWSCRCKAPVCRPAAGSICQTRRSNTVSDMVVNMQTGNMISDPGNSPHSWLMTPGYNGFGLYILIWFRAEVYIFVQCTTTQCILQSHKE